MSSLNIASRALTTNLAAMQVIGHNIANVNTDGYNRQAIDLTSSGGQFLGNGYFGKGVEIEGVSRAYDAYLTREAELTASLAAADEIRYQRLQQLESLFPLGDQSLGVSLNNALNAWSAIATSPTDTTARTVAISRAEELAARLRDTSANLDELRQSSTLQIQETVKSINNLASQIAEVNGRIITSQGAGRSPNDLLDQRDQLVLELNKYVQTNTVMADNGGLTVFVGGSQPLVLGSRASELVSKVNPLDGQRQDVFIRQAGQDFKLNESFLSGGELRGLLQFVNTDWPDAVNTLGRLALSLSEQVNAQHRLGLDINGNAGGNFYGIDTAGTPYSYGADGTISISANPVANTSAATVSASISDYNALKAADYELRFEDVGAGAVGMRAYRITGGVSTPLPPLSQPPFAVGLPPLVTPVSVSFDGLTLEISGAPVAGEIFSLKPYSDASRNLGVVLSSPENLAAASPVKVSVGADNAGSLTVEGLGATAVGPFTPVRLVFDAGTGQFNIYDNTPPVPVAPTLLGSTSAYSPGAPISFGGWTITLRGVPADGDSFDISAATGGDARQNFGNARAILGLRDTPSFDGVSLGDGYISVFSEVASKVQAGRFAAEFSATSASAAATARAAKSGVNLDEEAARLIQYQQAYQASAKFLQVAQGTFDTLIQAFS